MRGYIVFAQASRYIKGSLCPPISPVVTSLMTTPVSTFFTAQKFCGLPSFTGFTVSGVDATTFLQGQLTNDVKGLANQTSQRTGYCTPKGRLMATFLQWRINANTLGHLVPTELSDATIKRLRMFVLRAKASFSSADATLHALGLWGQWTATGQAELAKAGSDSAAAVIDLGRQIDGVTPDSITGPWLIAESACPTLGERAWLVGSATQIAAAKEASNQARELPEAAWRFSEIQNAKSWVWEKTKEAFVPQMINFELINGVSFTKGCYPGQEVVARSQYLGKLKRRTFRFDLDELPGGDGNALVGQDVWSATMTHEPCGQVVDGAQRFNSAGEPVAGAVLMVECTLDAWQSADLHLGAIDGPRLQTAAMPYAFPSVE